MSRPPHFRHVRQSCLGQLSQVCDWMSYKPTYENVHTPLFVLHRKKVRCISLNKFCNVMKRTFFKETIMVLMSQCNPNITNVPIIQLTQKKGGEKILLQENEMFLKGLFSV